MLNTFSFLLNLDFDHFSQDNFYVLGAGFGIHVFLLYIILSFFCLHLCLPRCGCVTPGGMTSAWPVYLCGSSRAVPEDMACCVRVQ